MTDKINSAAGSVPGAGGALSGVTSTVTGKLEGWGSMIAQQGQALIDSIFPPDKRAALLARIQAFALQNPKLSAFFLTNFALTGAPLFLFVLFSLTVLIFSVLVGLILGLLAAVLFTVFMVGTALLVVLPTVFFTTGAACFLFLWGLGGYYILKWANGDKADGKSSEGGSIGDRISSLTGGSLDGFMKSARAQDAKGDISGYNDEHTSADGNGGKANGKPAGGQSGGGAPHKAAGGAAKQVNGHVGDAAKKGQDAVGGVSKQAKVDGVTSKVANTKGTVTGGLSGATGLS